MPRSNACSIGSPRDNTLLLWPLCWRLLTKLASASLVSPMMKAPGLHPSSASRPCPLSSILFRELSPELGAGLFLWAQRQASQAVMRHKHSRGNITKYHKYFTFSLSQDTPYYHNATGKHRGFEQHQPRDWGSRHWWPGAGCAGEGCTCPWCQAWCHHYRRGGPGGWSSGTSGEDPGPGARGQRRWTGRGYGWAEPDWK